MRLPAATVLALLALIGCADCALAADAVSVCYNYDCLMQGDVVFSDGELRRVRDLLGDAQSPVHERALLGVAVGWMLGWAGQRLPINADRAGNLADEGVDGRMDCIDHSTTTTRLLRLLEARGWLRFHRVLEPVQRTRGLIFDHFSAQIEEKAADNSAPADEEVLARRYVVDSWYVDNGQPAPVLALQRWQSGDGPDDD
ncbi:hypothetical protein [Rhodocyclus tenuis]|uniref:hypothetical protein n=1 Tax=Rhodocyclus tenuis TaxID=1066 RepID=UPI001F5BE6E5|nr:hypothetical protein [Rhodocyclus tenuis]